MLFYLDLHVFAVKKGLSRLMEKSSGTDVRHTWGLKVMLAFCMWDLGQLLNCSESQFYLYYGDKTSLRGLNGITHMQLQQRPVLSTEQPWFLPRQGE